MKYRFHLIAPRSLEQRYVMEAYLSIEPVSDLDSGYLLTRRSLRQFLNSQGIVYGIQERVLSKIVQTGEAQRERVALGVPPERGEDASFELIHSPQSALYEQLLENYSGQPQQWVWPDFKRSLLPANTPLLKKNPPTTGSPGMSVKGELIPGLLGIDKPFPKMKNVKISPQDRNLLVSTIEGYPMINLPYSICIQQVFVLDRDLTESQYFPGIVAINGSVRDMVRISAEGDILIQGNVDAAVLLSQGHILISQGIKGKDMAVVKAVKSIRTGFAERCTLEAGYSVYAQDLMQTYCVALDQVHVKQVMGGEIRATTSIQAQLIGSAGLITQIRVGLNPYLDDQIQRIAQQIQTIESRLDTIRTEISELVLKAKKGPEDIMLRHLRGRIPRWEYELQNLQSRLELLREYQSRYSCAEIKCSKRIFAGTILYMGEFEYQLEKTLDQAVSYRAGRYGIIPSLQGQVP